MGYGWFPVIVLLPSQSVLVFWAFGGFTKSLFKSVVPLGDPPQLDELLLVALLDVILLEVVLLEVVLLRLPVAGLRSLASLLLNHALPKSPPTF